MNGARPTEAEVADEAKAESGPHSTEDAPDGFMRIVEARTAAQIETARSLIEEYVTSLPVDLSFQGYREEIAHFPRGYVPPDGVVLLSYDGEEPAGVVALRRLSDSACEMKRLYVRPKFRGRGIGRALSEELVRRAALLGYATMRLDTLVTMDAAIRLYVALGFQEIPPYRYNPVEGARYMELVLPGGGRRSGIADGPGRPT